MKIISGKNKGGGTMDIPTIGTRVMVFIDGNNLYHRLKDKGWKTWINVGSLAKKVTGQRNLVHIYYYNASPLGGRPYTESANKFLAYVENTPNLTIHKSWLQSVKKVNEYGSYQFHEEKGADTALSVDLVCLAAGDKFDTAIIISSDGDFEPAARAIQDEYKKLVEVVYFEGSRPFVMESCSTMRKFRKSYVDDDYIEPERSDDADDNEDENDSNKKKPKKQYDDNDGLVDIEYDDGIIPIKNRKRNNGKDNKKPE